MSDEIQNHHPAPSPRIEIPGDTLILDKEFCEEVLGGATTRTSKRYEDEGLPFAMVGGRKYRPLQEGLKWVAARIQRRGQPVKRRRVAG
jgi:hypothetical protein